MEIEMARERIIYYEEYIQKVESYQAETMKQKAIKLYVLRENVNKVANELNEQGHRIGSRKLLGKDISDIIRSKPADEMHELARKMFKRNRKRASTKW